MPPTSLLREPLTVEQLTRPAELEGLRPLWSALFARCPEASPFQAPEWVLPWLRHFGGEAWTLAVRRGRELVGVVPLLLRDEQGAGAPCRKLLLTGTGNTDLLDALAAPGSERAVAVAAIGALAERAGAWDVADLHQLPEGSPLRHAPAPAGWADEGAAQDARPVLRLPGRVEDLAGFVPPSRLRRLRDDRRRAARLGPVRIEPATAATLEEQFEALLRLHEARWSARGLPGVLSDGATRGFHREVAAAMLHAGRLRLYAASIGGRIVASFYGFTSGRATSYYLGGFDPEYGRLGLGVLIVGHAIEEAVREGSQAFDFLRGREPYKYEWGAADRPNFRRFLRPGGGA